jgi:uncharacterized membrane-anchored protein
MSSKRSVTPNKPWVDPALSDYESGLQALFGGKIAAARKHFEAVVASAEQPEIRARATSYLELCARRESTVAPPDDPYLEAVAAKNDGDFDAARDLASRGGRKGKDERFAYLAAAVEALSGNTAEAVRQLQQAIEMNAENRIHAFHDSDFQSLRGEPGFDELYSD